MADVPQKLPLSVIPQAYTRLPGTFRRLPGLAWLCAASLLAAYAAVSLLYLAHGDTPFVTAVVVVWIMAYFAALTTLLILWQRLSMRRVPLLPTRLGMYLGHWLLALLAYDLTCILVASALSSPLAHILTATPRSLANVMEEQIRASLLPLGGWTWATTTSRVGLATLLIQSFVLLAFVRICVLFPGKLLGETRGWLTAWRTTRGNTLRLLLGYLLTLAGPLLLVRLVIAHAEQAHSTSRALEFAAPLLLTTTLAAAVAPYLSFLALAYEHFFPDGPAPEFAEVE